MDREPIFSLSNPLFSKFAFYSGVVLLKTCFMSCWTTRMRGKKKAIISQEDKYFFKPEDKTVFHDPDVERSRNCHINDLENVVPFVLIGHFYVLTGPDPTIAVWLFRTFTAARIFHTLAYLMPLPAPSRAIGFSVGYFVNLAMLAVVLSSTSF